MAILATVRAPSNMHSGRSRPVRLILLHTAECPCESGRAVGIANYLAVPGRQASCHWVVGPDGVVAQVPEADTAWAAPGANADGIQIEQTAYAAFTPADWDSPGARLMLANTAALLAEISGRWSIPLRHLTDAELGNGLSGVITHVQASHVYGGDHWDCGPDYPIDHVIAMAAGGSPEGEDEMTEDDLKKIYARIDAANKDKDEADQSRYLDLAGKLDRLEAKVDAK